MCVLDLAFMSCIRVHLHLCMYFDTLRLCLKYKLLAELCQIVCKCSIQHYLPSVSAFIELHYYEVDLRWNSPTLSSCICLWNAYVAF